MTDKNHPYPDYIVEKVAEHIYDHDFDHPMYGDQAWKDMSTLSKSGWITEAHQVLTALWDASRVGDIEQLENVPDFASLVDGEGFTYRTYELRNPKVFPVNIIYWGNHDR